MTFRDILERLKALEIEIRDLRAAIEYAELDERIEVNQATARLQR